MTSSFEMVPSGQSHSDSQAMYDSLTVEEGLELKGVAFPQEGGGSVL